MSVALAPTRGNADPLAAHLAAARTAEVNALVTRCAAGSVLMRTHWPDGVGYSIEPSGEWVSSSAAAAAIATGALVGGDDALLAGSPSQTWRAP